MKASIQKRSLKKSKPKLGEKMTIDLDSMTVTITTEVNSTTVLARANLQISDWLTIKGFRIMHSKFRQDQTLDVYVQPPSIKTGDSWNDLVFFTPKELWREVEKKIITAFHAQNMKDAGVPEVTL
jgi:hypothetical protein